RLRATLEIDELDVEPGLLVFADLVREHGRQIAQAAGPADRDADVLQSVFRRGRAAQQRERAEQRRSCSQQSRCPSSCFGHEILPLRRFRSLHLLRPGTDETRQPGAGSRGPKARRAMLRAAGYMPAAALRTKRSSKVLARSTLAPLSSG